MHAPADRGPPPTVLMTADAVGGVWSYARGLCRALPDCRFILAILGPRPDAAQRAEIARLDNLELVESDFRLEWQAGGGFDLPESRRWLASLAERREVDLVHVNGYAHASLDSERPALVVAHSDVLSWWQAVHRCAAPPEWQPYRREAAAGLAAAAQIVAPTAAVLCDLARNFGVPRGRALVIANGIDPGGFPPLPKRQVVMAAGRIWDEAKNLAALAAVAADLDWPVEIAGDLDHPERGSAAIAPARPLGRLGAAEMAQRLGSAAIFAAPARYEPFGLGILEAAVAGCALVLGDIASLRETWDGAALFVDPEDHAALRSALRRLIADPEQRSHLAQAARRRAGRFTLDRMAQAYRALYRELARQPAPEPA